VQSVLDARQQQGSPLIRLIPISDSNIWRKVGEVRGEKEMPWNLLYGQQGLQCRGWGKERVAVFSGLTLQSQATLLELIDSLGLGRVTPGQLDETDYELPVGEVLAAAVTVYRKALQRKKDGFDLKEDFRRYQKVGSQSHLPPFPSPLAPVRLTLNYHGLGEVRVRSLLAEVSRPLCGAVASFGSAKWGMTGEKWGRVNLGWLGMRADSQLTGVAHQG
jgi:hypothetical protein